jgi:putative endopeptidase
MQRTSETPRYLLFAKTEMRHSSAVLPDDSATLYDSLSGDSMPSKFLLALAAALAAISLSLSGQQPAPQPLQSMPYSPSLDATSLDRSVDPCVDFYKFSCGGWEKNNPIPADQAGWSVYAKLANDNQQFLWGILEDDSKAPSGPSSAPRTPVQQKVGDYFAACMNTSTIDALGDTPLQPELAKIDALKTRADVLSALTRLHHEYAGSFLFASGTGQDAADSSTVIVELRAGGLGLPDRDYYTKTDEKSVKIREQYAAYIQQLAGGPGLIARMIKSRVPPVPRLWGPGKGNRAVYCASTQAVASLSRRPSIPIRFLRFRACRFDNGDSLTRATPQAW